MNEPKRWSEPNGEASADESELLRAGIAERMPSELRGQVWSAITLAAAGGTAATALGATSAAGTSKGVALSLSAATKGLIAVALLGGAGVGAVHVLSSQSPSASSQPPAPLVSKAASAPPSVASQAIASAVASAPPAATNLAARPAQMAASGRAKAVPAASASGPEEAPIHAVETASSRLREESAAVLAIRRALVAGNAREALSLLARARTDFPHGVLGEEREALSVRALMAAGETDAARKRGEAFLSRFPRSPQAGEVRRLLGSK